MNKIGFNVLAWSAGLSENLHPVINRLKKIGYDGVEFFIGSPDEKAYKRMGNYCRRQELGVTAVFTVGAAENPISADAAIRAAALDRIKWAIDRAADLESPIICGPFHSAHMVFAKRAPVPDEYKWGAEVMFAAGEYAATAGVILALEALNRFECYLCNTMEQLLHLLLATAHPHVRAMFDTHHANIEEKHYGFAIGEIMPFLEHVHISENDRGTPGEGQVIFDDAFEALSMINYEGWLTIEAFSRNDPDFANAIGVWRQFSPPWEIAEKGYTFIKEMCIKHGL